MGRSKGKRVLKRDFRQSREDKWDDNSRNKTGYDPHELSNPAFEEYYRTQQIAPEGEWEAFMAALRSPLPTTFRINGSGRFAADLRDRLDRGFLSQFSGEPIIVSGETLEPPQALSWYPDKLAWKFSFSRAQLRKLPMLEAIHELVKRENAAGSITRQEAVSMIPPLFLDVQPDHRVLDTCAAPGSKTAQVLEMLQQNVQQPSGCVVANDVEAQRCNLLTHQVKRMCSPALVVTNHDASQFPLVAPRGHAKGDEVRYDRVLCDVPCSGDGTLRKSPDIWRRWTSANGNGLHFLQNKIAVRACHLLKVGGRLVYSTCTFNPIEDEAVVANMLRCTHGAMELLDVSTELPSLKRLPGKTSWLVRDKAGFSSAFSPEAPGKLCSSMYPEDPQPYPLERCMRVLPHHNDSGGFFIAVLRKVKEIPNVAATSATTKSAATQPQASSAAPAKAAPAAEPAPALANGLSGTAQDEAAIAAPAGPATASRSIAAEQPASASDAPVSPSASAGAVQAVTSSAGHLEHTSIAGPSEPVDTPMPQAEEGRPVQDSTGAASSAAAPSTSGPTWGPRGGGARGREGPGGKWKGIDPVIPFTDAHTLSSMQEFYGFAPGFMLGQQLISRTSTDVVRPKRLYYVSAGVKALLTQDEQEQLKVTATGLKTFERQETKDGRSICAYRVAQEGVPVVLPYMTRQILLPSLEEFLALLTHRSLTLPPHLLTPTKAEDASTPQANGHANPCADAAEAVVEAAYEGDGKAAAHASVQASEAAQEPQAKKIKVESADAPSIQTEDDSKVKQEGQPKPTLSDPETLTQLEHIHNGCCILTLRPGEEQRLGVRGALSLDPAAGGPPLLAIVCWRGRGTLNILVSKAECQQMLETIQTAAAAGGHTLPGQSVAT